MQIQRKKTRWKCTKPIRSLDGNAPNFQEWCTLHCIPSNRIIFKNLCKLKIKRQKKKKNKNKTRKLTFLGIHYLKPHVGPLCCSSVLFHFSEKFVFLPFESTISHIFSFPSNLLPQRTHLHNTNGLYSDLNQKIETIRQKLSLHYCKIRKFLSLYGSPLYPCRIHSQTSGNLKAQIVLKLITVN